MRIHKPFQLQIPELHHIGLLPFLMHRTSCDKRIVRHIDDTIQGYLYHYRYYKQRTIFHPHITAVTYRHTHTDQKGLQAACKNYEGTEFQKSFPHRFRIGKAFHTGDKPHIQDIQTYQHGQWQSIGKYVFGHIKHTVRMERGRGKKQNNYQTKYKYTSDHKQQPVDIRRRMGSLFRILLMKEACESKDAPAEYFCCRCRG